MTVKLKPEVKRKWLRALREGAYQQGFTTLRREEQGAAHFCCLGVLSDLAAKAGVGRWGRVEFDGLTPYETEGERCECFLPSAVAEWAFGDRHYINPCVTTDGRLVPLSVLNDGSIGEPRMSFHQIANLIEEGL